MKFCLWNCRSLANKLKPFKSFVYSHSLDVIALTETWLSDRITDREILLSNYTLYRSDRLSRGGGAMICVSSTIPSRLIQSHSSVDMVSIELLSSPNIIISCVYIPPNCPKHYLTVVLDSMEDIFLLNKKLIVVGDFNAPDIEWSTLSASSPSSTMLCDLIFRLNLTQLIIN